MPPRSRVHFAPSVAKRHINSSLYRRSELFANILIRFGERARGSSSRMASAPRGARTQGDLLSRGGGAPLFLSGTPRGYAVSSAASSSTGRAPGPTGPRIGTGAGITRSTSIGLAGSRGEGTSPGYGGVGGSPAIVRGELISLSYIEIKNGRRRRDDHRSEPKEISARAWEGFSSDADGPNN